MGLSRMTGMRWFAGNGGANRRIFGIGQLGRRLALIFVAVALAAIAINVIISAETSGADVNKIAVRQEAAVAQSVAATAAAAYRGGTWANADLHHAFQRAQRGDAAVLVRDTAGHFVAESARFTQLPTAHRRVVPIRLGNDTIGEATVRFSMSSPGAMVRQFEATKWHARLVAAGIAALIAFVVSVIVARAITGPLEQLLEAVRARGRGSRSAQIKPVRGIGVIRELLESFNRSAVALDKQDRLGATWSPTSRTSCARRLRCCRPAWRPWSTGSPRSRPTASSRSAMRCCAWPRWSRTCSGWRRPSPRRCSSGSHRRIWRRSPPRRRTAWATRSGSPTWRSSAA